jgi:lysophospholipase L1-like esterase
MIKESVKVRTIFFTAGLLSLFAAERFLPNVACRGAAGHLRYAIGIARGRNPNAGSWGIIRDDNDGYYERLLTGAGRRAVTKTLLGWMWSRGTASPDPEPSNPYLVGDFLCYVPKAGLNWVGSDDPKELVTNSCGLADGEYPYQKAAETRRVALIGDSLSRGYGVRMGERYESLFENHLNAAVSGTARQFEVLNFSVDGYRLTQLFDVALNKASAFHPDVYIVTLTELSVSPDWGSHLAQLARQGMDLKYSFLRETIRAAGIRREDNAQLVRAKLAPYRLAVLRQALQALQAHAERESAQLIVLLLPAVEDRELITSRFRGIRDFVEELGITVVDLLDTYDDVPDIESMRLDWYDIHPNAAGHRLITENLVRKISGRASTWSALTGQPSFTRNGSDTAMHRPAVSGRTGVRSQQPFAAPNNSL